MGKEAKVADAHKAPRQYMEKEAAQKLIDRESSQALFVFVHRPAAGETFRYIRPASLKLRLRSQDRYKTQVTRILTMIFAFHWRGVHF
jgi:hypothetical protein